MDTELLNQIVLSSPNFIGLLLCVLILTQQLKKAHERNDKLLETWRDCERERRIQRLEQD